MPDATPEPHDETNDFPVLSVGRDDAPSRPSAHEPALDSAAFIGRRSHPDGLAIARLSGSFLDPHALAACAISPGFRVELCAERTIYRRAVIIGMEIHRDDPHAGAQCVVRFSCGPSYVHATIDVPQGP